MKDDCIRITGLTATGRHGVFASERRNGQVFVVDIAMGFEANTDSDDLADTIDYSMVGRDVVGLIEGLPVNLIETLAGRIAQQVLTYERVREVEITVHKPQAPMGVQFGDVSVTIRRRRA